MNYWVFVASSVSDAAKLAFVPKNGPDAYEYDEGESLLDDYPGQEDMPMSFDSDYPEGVKLYDVIYNVDRVIVANGRVKACLDALGESNIEYLPITLLDHKKEVASLDYFILNPLGGEEIIDMDKSEYRIDPLDDEQIDRIKNLVVNSESVSQSANFFRAKTKGNCYFITDNVKAAFEEAGITGYKLFEAEGWDGLNV